MLFGDTRSNTLYRVCSNVSKGSFSAQSLLSWAKWLLMAWYKSCGTRPLATLMQAIIGGWVEDGSGGWVVALDGSVILISCFTGCVSNYINIVSLSQDLLHYSNGFTASIKDIIGLCYFHASLEIKQYKLWKILWSWNSDIWNSISLR